MFTEGVYFPPPLLVIMWIILILILCLVIFFIIKHRTKNVKVPSVFLITGAVKSGKSALSVYFAIKEYRKNLLSYYLKLPIYSILRLVKKKEIPLKPMLYTNMPLAKVKYNDFTLDILLRKVRIPNGSVVLLDEVSLLADSMLFKDKKINNELMLFIKLFAHYTHGGKLICNTQAFSDLHFAFKRCINNFLYIHSSTKYPLITIFKVREMLYMDETNITNSFNADIEDTTKKLIVFNRVYKRYDRFYLSSFTDKLNYQVDYNIAIKSFKDDLKSHSLVSLQGFKLEVKKQ